VVNRMGKIGCWANVVMVLINKAKIRIDLFMGFSLLKLKLLTD
jgi:hypothetical protein